MRAFDDVEGDGAERLDRSVEAQGVDGALHKRVSAASRLGEAMDAHVGHLAALRIGPRGFAEGLRRRSGVEDVVGHLEG